MLETSAREWPGPYEDRPSLHFYPCRFHSDGQADNIFILRDNYLKISNEDRPPPVDLSLKLLEWQEKRIDELEQKILNLKGETTKSKIKPSKMDKDTAENGDADDSDASKPKQEPKRSKTGQLKIDATIDSQPDTIPGGSSFKGYREVMIEDIVFETFNTCYRLAQYQIPDGLDGCHFGKNLINFILYQYAHLHVTQLLLLKQLPDLGVDISSARLSQLS